MDKETNKYKEYVLQNLPLIIGIGVTVVNLYIASILSPLKTDIIAQAKRVDEIEVAQDEIEKEGSINSKLNSQRIEALENAVLEIKALNIRIEDKLDRYLSNR